MVLEEDDASLSTLQKSSTTVFLVSSSSARRRYHPVWGPLFRSGNQASRFAKQVIDYSCIYTSRASNLVATSPSRSFRPPLDVLPHDDEGRGEVL